MAATMNETAIREEAPTGPQVTEYDRIHAPRYLRLLDAERAGADWEEAAQIILGLDPKANPVDAKQTFDSHLARAHWMMESGYKSLLGLPPG